MKVLAGWEEIQLPGESGEATGKTWLYFKHHVLVTNQNIFNHT
jgi:hypothetical protein